MKKPHLFVCHVGQITTDNEGNRTLLGVFRDVVYPEDFYYYQLDINKKHYGWWFTGNPLRGSKFTERISGNNIKVVTYG